MPSPTVKRPVKKEPGVRIEWVNSGEMRLLVHGVEQARGTASMMVRLHAELTGRVPTVYFRLNPVNKMSIREVCDKRKITQQQAFDEALGSWLHEHGIGWVV